MSTPGNQVLKKRGRHHRLPHVKSKKPQPHTHKAPDGPTPHHTSSTTPRQTGNQYRTALMHPSAHSVCVFHTRPNSYFQHVVVVVTYISLVCVHARVLRAAASAGRCIATAKLSLLRRNRLQNMAMHFRRKISTIFFVAF